MKFSLIQNSYNGIVGIKYRLFSGLPYVVFRINKRLLLFSSPCSFSANSKQKYFFQDVFNKSYRTNILCTINRSSKKYRVLSVEESGRNVDQSFTREALRVIHYSLLSFCVMATKLCISRVFALTTMYTLPAVLSALDISMHEPFTSASAYCPPTDPRLPRYRPHA